MLNWLKSLFGTKPASETPVEAPATEEVATDLTGEPLVAEEVEAVSTEEEVK